MTRDVITFPETWRVALAGSALVTPVVSGVNLVFADVKTLRGIARVSGAPAWSVQFTDEIDGLVAVDGGCILSTAEAKGHRILMVDDAGRIVWELDGRWNVSRLGLAAAGDRFLLSAAARERPEDMRLWEMRTGDGSTMRWIPGWSRESPIAIVGGWAWVDVREETPSLRVLDDAGDRILATGQFRALASAGPLILADGDGLLRAFEPTGRLLWERPGGASRALAADERVVVCGRRAGDDTWVRCYDLQGNEQWESGPFPSALPSLRFWQDAVIASGVRWGTRRGVIVLERDSGEILTRETGSWSSVAGGIPVDDTAAYAMSPAPHIARRERRRWARIEDAWDPAYLIAVAAQLDWWLPRRKDDASFRRLKEILAAIDKGGKSSPFVDEVVVPGAFDLTELRDVTAAIRSAGRTAIDRLKSGVAWLACAADWPLERTLPDDLPHRRVEMITFDDRLDDPAWNDRERIAAYPQLRSLVLRFMGLDGGPMGIELGALPCLEYLDLGENVLTRVPPEVRDCKQLISLNLRKNNLMSIEPDELPKSLLRLDVGQNPLPKAAAERLREALPQAYVQIY